MSKKSLLAVARVFLLLLVSPAWAYMGPAWISPENPSADDVIQVRISQGICDFLSPDAGSPELTQDDRSFRFLAFGFHNDSLDWCIVRKRRKLRHRQAHSG